MKKSIRWQGLGGFLGILIIFSILWFLLIDGFVERMIEKFGTQAVGAKVELDDADLSLFPAGLKLIRLQITDPDKPMTNAVEITRMNMSLDTLNLFRRKIIIEEMTLDGVRLNTPRKTSGAIESRPLAMSTIFKKVSKEGISKQIKLSTFKVADVTEILKREELQSMKLVESLQTDIQTEREKWQKQLGELPDKEKFDEYRSRIEQLQSKRKGPLGGLLSAGSDVAAIQKEIQHDLGRIKQARQELDYNMKSLKRRLDQAKKAPLKDVERLKKKYSLSPQGLSNMSRLLLGSKLNEWTQKAINWYEKLKPVLERAKKKEKGHEVVEPMRGKGVNIRFKEYAPLPDFLIRQVKANLQLQAGDIAGRIENITPDQDILGIPLTFVFSGEKMKGLHSLKLDGAMDHIIASSSKDKVNLRLQGYEVRNVALSDKAQWPITLKKGVADLEMRAILKDDNITANLSANLKSVRFSAGAQESASPLVKAMGSALSDVSKFMVKADVTGTLEDYDIQLTSDLDRVLKASVGNMVRKQAARLEKDLKKAIFAKADGPLGQLKNSLGGFDAIDGELTNRLNIGSGLLGGSKLPF